MRLLHVLILLASLSLSFIASQSYASLLSHNDVHYYVEMFGHEAPTVGHRIQSLAEDNGNGNGMVDEGSSSSEAEVDASDMTQRRSGDIEIHVEAVRMRHPNGSLYECHVPVDRPARIGGEDAAWSEPQKGKLHRRARNQLQDKMTHAGNNGIASIQVTSPETVAEGTTAAPLPKPANCVYKSVDWWSYELCWNRFVRQFHIDATSVITNEFVLGRGPLAYVEGGTGVEDMERVTNRKDGPYANITYYNGTVCDLTGSQRQTEVRLFCADDHADELAETMTIMETRTCAYQVTWYTKHACVPELRKDRSPELPIRCYLTNG